MGWGWVLLKGMKQTSSHWVDVPDLLAERLAGGPVHTFDLPGTGIWHEQEVPWTIDAMADQVREQWLPHADDAENWGILGLSMGGMVAMSWAHRHHHDFDALVVGNTSTRDVGAVHERLYWRSWRQLARVVRARPLPRRERMVLDLICASYPDVSRDMLARHYTHLAETQPFGASSFIRQLVASAQFRVPERLDLPVRVLVGEGDRFVSPSCSRRLAKRLGVPLVSHPTAGHDLSLDAPVWLAEELVRFSEEVSATLSPT